MSSVESALAKTIYNESRGEGKEGMDAIASTIKNRYEVNRPSLGGQDYENIVSTPEQYTGYSGEDPMKSKNFKKDEYEYSLKLAHDLVSGNHKDTTGGSTHRSTFVQYEKAGNFSYQGQIKNHYYFKAK